MPEPDRPPLHELHGLDPQSLNEIAAIVASQSAHSLSLELRYRIAAAVLRAGYVKQPVENPRNDGADSAIRTEEARQQHIFLERQRDIVDAMRDELGP